MADSVALQWVLQIYGGERDRGAALKVVPALIGIFDLFAEIAPTVSSSHPAPLDRAWRAVQSAYGPEAASALRGTYMQRDGVPRFISAILAATDDPAAE